MWAGGLIDAPNTLLAEEKGAFLKRLKAQRLVAVARWLVASNALLIGLPRLCNLAEKIVERDHHGLHFSAGAAIAAVPEPGSLVLAISPALGLLSIARRRRRA